MGFLEKFISSWIHILYGLGLILFDVIRKTGTTSVIHEAGQKQ